MLTAFGISDFQYAMKPLGVHYVFTTTPDRKTQEIWSAQGP